MARKKTGESTTKADGTPGPKVAERKSKAGKSTAAETEEQKATRFQKEADQRAQDATDSDVIPMAGSPGGPYPNTLETRSPLPQEMKARMKARTEALDRKAEAEEIAKQNAENATHGLYPYGAGGLGASGASARAHKAQERAAAKAQKK